MELSSTSTTVTADVSWRVQHADDEHCYGHGLLRSPASVLRVTEKSSGEHEEARTAMAPISNSSKKRARNDEQKHNKSSSDDDEDIVEVKEDKVNRSNGSKSAKTAPRQSVASTSSSIASKSKQPTIANGSKKAVSMGKSKVKGVNDALKDFQATFGLSSPSSSSSTSKTAAHTPAKPPAPKNVAKSTPSLGRTAFKNSFGNAESAQKPPDKRAETPVRNAASRVSAKSRSLGSSLPIPASSTHTSTGLGTRSKTTTQKCDAAGGAYEEEKSELLTGEGSDREEQEDDDEHAQRLREARKGKRRAVPEDDAEDDLDTESFERGHAEPLRRTVGTTASHRSDGPGNHKHARISSLSELSAKKKMYSLPVDVTTPSKPSPLASSTINRQRLGTESVADGDVKPLRALGALNAPSSTTDWNQISETGHRSSTISARLANTSAAAAAPIRDVQQDVTELLSPRKKRKGWVPAGYAESAAGVIKRFQTGSNLWIHEISRTLDTFGKCNAGGTGASVAGKVKKELLEQQEDEGSIKKGRRDGKRTYEQLLRDLNPHLRLEIIEVLSPKPASLTWSSAEGGFITAGAAEKLLITRCKILKDDETFAAALGSQHAGEEQTMHSLDVPQEEEGRGPPLTPGSAAVSALEQQIEGLVIFSLAGHSRTSTGITLARKEQDRPHRGEPVEGTANAHETGEDVNKNGQQRLRFGEVAGKACTLFVPASIADLHVQMRAGDQIWTWEPWSVVDLVDMPGLAGSAMHRRTMTSEENTAKGQAQGGDTSQKALLISRFGVIL